MGILDPPAPRPVLFGLPCEPRCPRDDGMLARRVLRGLRPAGLLDAPRAAALVGVVLFDSGGCAPGVTPLVLPLELQLAMPMLLPLSEVEAETEDEDAEICCC